MNNCTLKHRNDFKDHEFKTKLVLLITLATMVVEIVVGYLTGSMALLADGWHMGSHALAMFLSVVVYWLYRQSWFKEKFSFGGGKILSLGGYTSAWFLVLIAILMGYESLQRLRNPVEIQFSQALTVSILGLVVNLVCAYILYDRHDHDHHNHDHHDHHHHNQHKNHHHEHEVHDHNHQSALYHVIADALTSLLAILALYMGARGWQWMDPAMGILGGVLVLRWGGKMIKKSALDLMDAHESSVDQNKLRQLLLQHGVVVKDLHVWRLGPGDVACEAIVSAPSLKVGEIRDLIQKDFSIQHLVVQMDS